MSQTLYLFPNRLYGSVASWLKKQAPHKELPSYLAANLRVLTPHSSVMERVIEEQRVELLRAEYAPIFAAMLLQGLGVGIEPSQLLDFLENEFVVEKNKSEVDLARAKLFEILFRAAVFETGSAIMRDHTFYSARDAKLLELCLPIGRIDVAQKVKDAALIRVVDEVLGFAGVRGYEVYRNGAWREVLKSGDATLKGSRFAAGEAAVSGLEEKTYLTDKVFEIIAGQGDENGRAELERYEKAGFVRLLSDEKSNAWHIFHILDRKKCSFIESTRIAQDETIYGEGNVNEIMFLVVGDPAMDSQVRVYQFTNWQVEGKPLLERGEADLKVVVSLAETLANAYLNEKFATTDPLTRLYTRQGLSDYLLVELERAQRYAQSFSVLYIDIDNFKAFNTEYGHKIGDKVLQTISHIVVSKLRPYDRVVRFGGDEIVVFMPNTDQPGAGVAAARIREAVEQEDINVVGDAVRMTVTIGGVAAGAGKMGAILGEIKSGIEPSALSLIVAANEKLLEMKVGQKNRAEVIQLS